MSNPRDVLRADLLPDRLPFNSFGETERSTAEEQLRKGYLNPGRVDDAGGLPSIQPQASFQSPIERPGHALKTSGVWGQSPQQLLRKLSLAKTAGEAAYTVSWSEAQPRWSI